MLNIWFTADFHLGHKNIIRYYSLCAEALFYLNRCRQLPSTSCLHPSELMHANMPDTIVWLFQISRHPFFVDSRNSSI